MKTNTLHGDFVLLGVNQLKILIDQSEATKVTHLEDKKDAASNWISSVEWLANSIEQNITGYASISSDLEIIPQFPDKSFVVTNFKVAPNISWCWREVQLLNNITLEIEDFPEILKVKNTPITSITTLKDGNQAFICDSEKLLNYVLQQ